MNPIEAAVSSRKQASVDRAVDFARKNVTALIKKLADAGMDLNVAAPYPKGTMSRIDYRQAADLRNTFERITRATESSRSPIAPNIRVIDEEAVARFYAVIADNAGSQFDSYVAKLSAKVGAVTEAAIDAGQLWNGSRLTVKTVAGEQQVWNTKMSLNVSCLGKLFNQWPTRRVK